MYAVLEPYTYADAQNDYSLQEFLRAIGEMYEEIIDLAYDTDAGDDGWTLLLDVTRVPSKAIDWLSQFVGVTQIAGLTDQQKIDRIIAREGFKRGTPAGMRAAASIFLTGTQTVNLYERDTSPYHLAVNTYTSETPNSAAVLAALTSQKPAGIVMVYTVTNGQTYQQLRTNHSPYSAMKAFYSNYDKVRKDTP
jgi:hypothetical protein